MVLQVTGLLIRIARSQEPELYVEKEPLSYGYVIRDSSGRVLYTVGRNWFDDDLAAATCLDGSPAEGCLDELDEVSEDIEL